MGARRSEIPPLGARTRSGQNRRAWNDRNRLPGDFKPPLDPGYPVREPIHLFLHMGDAFGVAGLIPPRRQNSTFEGCETGAHVVYVVTQRHLAIQKSLYHDLQQVQACF